MINLIRNTITRLQYRISMNPRAFRIYSILRILVIITAVRSAYMRNYESLALCILSLILFLMPSLFEGWLHVQIPASFQIIIYLFIYAAEILGEINNFYTAIPGWDTMLHTMNGFLCAAIGISLVGILNRGSKNLSLSPFYVAMMGFCFSMTIGVIWEFFEFAMDQIFLLDMQKDFVVQQISSVTLDPNNSQAPYVMKNITRTLVESSDGTTIEIAGGYLDLGIIDTMKDLIVNFIGAIVFSVMAYLYEKTKERGKFTSGLIIRPMSDEEAEEVDAEITERMKFVEEKIRERKAERKNRKKNKGRNRKKSRKK